MKTILYFNNTYFGNFQLAAYEIQIAGRWENGTVAVRTQSETAVVALEAKALFLIVTFCPGQYFHVT